MVLDFKVNRRLVVGMTINFFMPRLSFVSISDDTMHPLYKSAILLVAFAIAGSLGVNAAERDSLGSGRSFSSCVSVDVKPSFAAAFRDDVLRKMVQSEDAKRTRFASSYHLKYSFTQSSATEAGRFFPGVYQGSNGNTSFPEPRSQLVWLLAGKFVKSFCEVFGEVNFHRYWPMPWRRIKTSFSLSLTITFPSLPDGSMQDSGITQHLPSHWLHLSTIVRCTSSGLYPLLQLLSYKTPPKSVIFEPMVRKMAIGFDF